MLASTFKHRLCGKDTKNILKQWHITLRWGKVMTTLHYLLMISIEYMHKRKNNKSNSRLVNCIFCIYVYTHILRFTLRTYNQYLKIQAFKRLFTKMPKLLFSKFKIDNLICKLSDRQKWFHSHRQKNSGLEINFDIFHILISPTENDQNYYKLKIM